MFVDANIFLRHLVNEGTDESARATALFEQVAEGSRTVWTTWVALAEVVYMLSSKKVYDVPRRRVADLLSAIVSITGIDLPDKAILPRVFQLYASLPIDFPDAYHAALIEHRHETELLSFDHDFDRIPTLTRREP